jgi:hypothetical protein
MSDTTPNRPPRVKSKKVSQEFLSTLYLSTFLNTSEEKAKTILDVLVFIGYSTDDPLSVLINDLSDRGPIAFIRRLPDSMADTQVAGVVELITKLLDMYPHGLQATRHVVYGNDADASKHGRAEAEKAERAERLREREEAGRRCREEAERMQREAAEAAEASAYLPGGHDAVPQPIMPHARLQRLMELVAAAEEAETSEKSSDSIVVKSLSSSPRSDEALSVQELHALGKCRPCHFHTNSKEGCRNGDNCSFCHMHPKRPSKVKRDRERRRKLREEINVALETGRLSL